MALKVRTLWLVGPIVLGALLVIGAVYVLQHFNVEQSTTGYDYKEKLFNEEAIGTINISVSEVNWQKILDDPVAEEYVEATVTVNGETYDNVGIRAKGNSSLTSVANSESERYSLKIDFAQYDKKQTYYGLDTVNLNNNFSDTTQMKEFVSYELMEQIGIATPAHAYVKVLVNGENYGLMLAVEEVGEAFAKTNFGSTEGYLFKPENAGSDLAYVSDDVSDYAGIFDSVKMNKKTAEKNSNVIKMMKEISEGDTSSINVDQIARYFAMNTALVNLDSYQGSFKHNYYLYEDGEGQFSILPWDYNMAFGGFNMGGGMNGGKIPSNVQKDALGAVSNEAQNDETNQPAPKTSKGQQVAPPNGSKKMSPSSQGEQQKPPMNDKNQMPPFDVQGEQMPSTNMPNNEGEQSEDENDIQLPSMFGGNAGGGLMLNETIVTDGNVHFSITEPVSGTTVDARPLLKIILEDEEARAKYDSYLEEIATDILTEKNVLSITTKLHRLLLDAVDEDPSKFSTTEQFVAGVSGEQSLPEFANQRSDSILKQLSGEIEGISNAGESNMPGGNGPQMGGMPNDNNAPQMNGKRPNGNNPPEINGERPNGNAGEKPDFENLPDFENMPEMNGEMPNRPGDRNGAFNNGPNSDGKYSWLLLGSTMGLLLLALLAILLLSQMKYKRR